MGQAARGACHWLTGTGRLLMGPKGLACICQHVEKPLRDEGGRSAALDKSNSAGNRELTC
jgi:hypothetical protein